jgi:hypothetical protein
MTPLQLEASAKAPCSSTIVGLVRPVLETASARVSWPVAGAFDAALGMVAAAL